MAQKQFYTSLKEMNRRAKAFTSLICCWIAGLAFIITLSSSEYQQAMILFTSLLCIILLMMWIYTMYYLYIQHINVHIWINNSLLTKAGRVIKRSIDLRYVKVLNIKYTTRGDIRQIILKPQTGKSLRIDGIEDFDKLVEKILSSNSKIMTIKRQEKVDYDHVLFYPLFSTLLTAVVVIIMALLLHFV